MDSIRVQDPEIEKRCDALLLLPLHAQDKNYVESFRNFFRKHFYLTEKQFNFLKSIEQRYSKESIDKSLEWIANFDEEKRKRLDIAFDYYRITPYFSDLVNKIARNPNFIPTEKQYNSMCHNKYVDAAIRNFNAPPKYNLCDLVVFRETTHGYRDRNVVGMIEDINEKGAYSAGMRTYKMLIIGSEESLSVTEKEIKLYRKGKKNV